MAIQKPQNKQKSVKASRFMFVENNILRVLFYCALVLVLAVVFLVIGLMIGYSILGDGQPWDVLKWSTWQHILDFLK